MFLPLRSLPPGLSSQLQDGAARVTAEYPQTL
jgi:hypothetical protein